MAFETQDMVPLGEHSRVHRSVWFVAGRAALAHGFVFEDKRPTLRDMALAAGLLLRGKSSPAANDRLAFVWVVTIRATDPLLCSDRTGVRPVEYRMRVRQAEFTALVEVTLETRFGRAIRIDNGVRGAA